MELLEERLGMLDCYFGYPPEENASEAYLRGYGKTIRIRTNTGKKL